MPAPCAARRKLQLNTALKVACSALQTFEEALGVPYALPKMDLVGVPNFAAGAVRRLRQSGRVAAAAAQRLGDVDGKSAGAPWA